MYALIKLDGSSVTGILTLTALLALLSRTYGEDVALVPLQRNDAPFEVHHVRKHDELVAVVVKSPD